MEAAGGRALRVNRQRASSRAFELAAPVWEAAAASYGDALRVRWASWAWRSRVLFRSHPSAGRPRRPPRTELQAAEGRAGATGPAGLMVKRFQGEPPRGRQLHGQFGCFDCPKPVCSGPGTPTESARQPRHLRTASACAEAAL